MRILVLLTLTLGIVAALPAAEPDKSPIAPRTIKWEKPGGTLGDVTAALTKQSAPVAGVAGVPIEVPEELRKQPCSVKFKETPFWEALQQAADRTDTRIVLTDFGRKVSLVPRGGSKEAVATSGAFRIVAQEVLGKALLEEGVTFHQVKLLIHWEPRLRVYRVYRMNITKVADVLGSKLTAEAPATQTLPEGARIKAEEPIYVKVNGLKNSSAQITSLVGEFTVTATDRLLAFKFDEPGKVPSEQKKDGVTATLKRVEKDEDTWEIEVELTYPPDQPVFESFQQQWWLKDNRLLVQAPNAAKSFPITDYELRIRGNTVRAIHRYKEDAKNGLGAPTAKDWSIVYETPAPLVEAKIPFELKNIPLP
ncbi:MAG: hypothetical protein L0241_21655 [Planctomycetia bacterium]|nr:hypothetical protein [Planctomycetia bacterium]